MSSFQQIFCSKVAKYGRFYPVLNGYTTDLLNYRHKVKMPMLFQITAIFRKECLLAYRHRIEFLNPLLFFTLVTLLFPLAITFDPTKLMQIGPGVIWIAWLFANLLTIENIFTTDYEDGTLEQTVLNSDFLPLQVLAKIIVHWLLTTLPLLIVSLAVSKLFFISNHGIMILLLSLLLGSPVLTLIGSIGSALTLGLRNRGIILVLLVLPLYLPVLIFGAGAVNDASLNLPVTSHLAFLGALLVLFITFVPVAAAAAIKISLE